MTTQAQSRVTAVRPGEGEAHWWTGELATVKLASEQTGGRLSMIEILAPAGLEVPLHVHRAEDEIFYILEGSATFEVDGRTIEAGPGACLLGPRDVPHRYTVGPDGCRMLFLFTPGGFEGFVRESGEPATARTLPPEDVTVDLDRLAAAAGRYDCELLGG